MKERQHDDYPGLSFTCEGGPHDGELFRFPKAAYTRGGTTPNIAQVLKDGIRISTLREVDGARAPIAGRYRVEYRERDGTFTAVHVPSKFDVYSREPARSFAGLAVPLSAVPAAAKIYGMPVYGVIPEAVSTLSNIDLSHGQG